MARKVHPEIAQLIFALDRSFLGRGWQGATLLGSIRGVTARESLACPEGILHPIWQLVRHAAYWKYAACVRLGALPPGSFPYSPSNWPDVPQEPNEKAWAAERKLLTRLHTSLVEVVKSTPPAKLDKVPPGGKSATVRQLVTGVAAHDAYHTGQIQLTKALVRRASQ